MAAETIETRTTLYIGDLDWWLNCADAARNHHAQNYDRGSVTANPLNTPPWTERHFELGRSRAGAFTKDRRIRAAWLRFSADERRVLCAHYRHARWPLGARHLSICERPIGDNESLYMPGAALFLAGLASPDGKRLGQLLDAIQRRPADEVVVQARERACRAVLAAHRTWFGGQELAATAEASTWLEA